MSDRAAPQGVRRGRWRASGPAIFRQRLRQGADQIQRPADAPDPSNMQGAVGLERACPRPWLPDFDRGAVLGAATGGARSEATDAAPCAEHAVFPLWIVRNACGVQAVRSGIGVTKPRREHRSRAGLLGEVYSSRVTALAPGPGLEMNRIDLASGRPRAAGVDGRPGSGLAGVPRPLVRRGGGIPAASGARGFEASAAVCHLARGAMARAVRALPPSRCRHPLPRFRIPLGQDGTTIGAVAPSRLVAGREGARASARACEAAKSETRRERRQT